MTITCTRCGASQEDGSLVCAACGGFVHEREMTELMHRARSLEATGRADEARDAWKRILSLLTPDAKQRAAVEAELTRLGGVTAATAASGTNAPISPGKAGRVGGAVALAMFVLSKTKFLLLGLGKFKTILSMLVMAGIYTSFYGWRFAVGIVVLIWVHEMGHVLAIRQRGLEASWPVFVPFVGAFVRLKSHPRSAAEDAYIGYAGPLLGSLAAAGVWAAAAAGGSRILLALAFFGFYINFFNLVAIPPLDGGRVTNALGRGEWVATLALLWAGAAWHPDGMVVLIAIVASVRGLAVIFSRGPRPSFALSRGERWSAALAYGVLALVLTGAMKATRPAGVDRAGHSPSVQTESS